MYIVIYVIFVGVVPKCVPPLLRMHGAYKGKSSREAALSLVHYNYMLDMNFI